MVCLCACVCVPVCPCSFFANVTSALSIMAVMVCVLTVRIAFMQLLHVHDTVKKGRLILRLVSKDLSDPGADASDQGKAAGAVCSRIPKNGQSENLHIAENSSKLS